MDGGSGRGLPSGELTFLFTDIQGSTDLFHQLGDAWPPVVREHDALLTAAIEARGGLVLKREGDAVFAVFDDAGAAVGAAVDAQRRLASSSWPSSVEVPVRMGLHTGEVEPIGDDYISLHVHRAARVAAAAHGGQILVSEATSTRAPPPEGVTFRDLGRFRLRGFDTPEPLLQVCHPELRDGFAPPRTPRAGTAPAGVRPTSFVGRAAEQAALAAAVTTERLVTLLGPGGVGKTRLSVELTSTIDGLGEVRIVELAPIEAGGHVSGVVAEALGVPTKTGGDIDAALVEYLEGRSMLLVLDNCEHVIESAAALVANVLRRCPDVHVLATSRTPLDLDGEHLLRLSPLGDADALRLFTERATAARASFAVDAETEPLVLALCRRLDGLPLALELAAARLRSMDLRSLVERVEHHVGRAVGGDRTRDLRQRSLDALIDWSYSLLDDEVATTFARLSAFADRFDLKAASAVGARPGEIDDVIDHVAVLVDHSLVEFDPTREPPYHLLETVREFARRRLDERADRNDVLARHRAYHLALVGAAVAGLLGPNLRDAEQHEVTLEGVTDELAAALRWSVEQGDGEEALRLAIAMALVWLRVGRVQEAEDALASALAIGAGGHHRARALVLLAEAASRMGDNQRSEEVARRALELAEELDDDVLRIDARDELAGVAWLRGATADGEAHGLEILRLARRIDDPAREARGLRLLALNAEFRGDYPHYLARAREALDASSRAEDARAVATSLTNLAVALGRNKQWDQARARQEEGLRLHLALGNRFQVAMALGTVSYYCQIDGDFEQALAYAREALEFARGVGARAVAFALNNLAEAQLGIGDLDGAQSSYLEALDIAVRAEEVERTSYCLDGLATIAARTGEHERAVQLVAGTEQFRRRHHYRLPDEYQSVNEALLTDAREQLGSDRFAAAWATGAELSSDDLVRAARPGFA